MAEARDAASGEDPPGPPSEPRLGKRLGKRLEKGLGKGLRKGLGKRLGKGIGKGLGKRLGKGLRKGLRRDLDPAKRRGSPHSHSQGIGSRQRRRPLPTYPWGVARERGISAIQPPLARQLAPPGRGFASANVRECERARAQRSSWPCSCSGGGMAGDGGAVRPGAPASSSESAVPNDDRACRVKANTEEKAPRGQWQATLPRHFQPACWTQVAERGLNRSLGISLSALSSFFFRTRLLSLSSLSFDPRTCPF